MSYDTNITIISNNLEKLELIARTFDHDELAQACSCDGRGGATSRGFRDAVIRSAIAMNPYIASGLVPPFLVEGQGEGYSDGRGDFWRISVRGGVPRFLRGEISYTRLLPDLDALDLP